MCPIEIGLSIMEMGRALSPEGHHQSEMNKAWIHDTKSGCDVCKAYTAPNIFLELSINYSIS